MKYTEDHEWILVEGENATIGITEYAQEQLGELVYVELPALGSSFHKGDAVAVVESVKTASDIFAPLDGTVVAVNQLLESDPGLINRSALKDGWIFRLKMEAPGQLGELLDEEKIDTES